MLPEKRSLRRAAQRAAPPDPTAKETFPVYNYYTPGGQEWQYHGKVCVIITIDRVENFACFPDQKMHDSDQMFRRFLCEEHEGDMMVMGAKDKRQLNDA